MLLLAGLGCGDGDGDRRSSAGAIFDRREFLNIAHRGGGRLAPEHTLVAYRNAVAVGADVVELDLHATADGVIVSLHDDRVDRTTNGTGLVREMAYAELRQLDAGYRFTRDGGQTFPWRGQGVTIPTLAEALDELGDVPLSVEIKQRAPAIAAAVIALFEARGILDHAVFAAFAPEPIEQIRQLAPDARTAFTSREIAELAFIAPQDLDSYQPPAGYIQPPKELVEPTYLGRAHQLGLKVHAWTVNDRGEMCRLRQMGVDGLFTDDPALLEQVKQDPLCAPAT